MQLNPAEISELIKSRIEGLAASSDIRNEGTVVSVSDGIVRVHGLSEVMQGEMLEFPATADGQPSYGLALNLERDSVGAVILGEYEHISEGDTVKCTGRILEVPVGPELVGRVVNALGQPIDGKGPINAKLTDVIEKVAVGVIFPLMRTDSGLSSSDLKVADALWYFSPNLSATRRRNSSATWRGSAPAAMPSTVSVLRFTLSPEESPARRVSWISAGTALVSCSRIGAQ